MASAPRAAGASSCRLMLAGIVAKRPLVCSYLRARERDGEDLDGWGGRSPDRAIGPGLLTQRLPDLLRPGGRREWWSRQRSGLERRTRSRMVRRIQRRDLQPSAKRGEPPRDRNR